MPVATEVLCECGHPASEHLVATLFDATQPCTHQTRQWWERPEEAQVCSCRQFEPAEVRV